MRILARMLIVLSLAMATSLYATVFQPTTDRELIDRSQLIVVATVRDASPHLRPDGYVATDYHLAVEETLKGSAAGVITVSEIGGAANGRFTFIADSATYTPGERVLAFLKARGDGTWFTTSMAIGKFSYGHNMRGQTIVTRDVSELRSDPERLADQFELFVLGASWGFTTSGSASSYATFEPIKDAFHPIAQSFPASAYCLDGGGFPVRWAGGESGATVTFYVTGTLPSVNSGTTASGIANGLAAWTVDPNAGIILNGGTNAPPSNAAAPNPDDGNSVIYLGYDAPVSGICDSALACTLGSGNFTHVYKSETFISISDVDIVVRTVIASSQFEGIITHEFGHAIGFRHANQGTPDDSGATAIMNSSVPVGFGSNLQQWDHDANDTVYGNGPPCTAPSIQTQPSSQSISLGSQANLSVGASGTATLTYQWYSGGSPTTGSLVTGATSSVFHPTPATTTSYSVRVSNSCSGVHDADSNTVVVTVTCTPPSAPTPIAAPSSIPNGQSSTISVNATGSGPLTYQWYVGNSGDTSTPIGGATNSFVTVSPTVTTTYWVRVTGQCAPVANSPNVTVTVTCSPIASQGVIAQPSIINPGGSSTLFFNTAGTGPFAIQWYTGGQGDTSKPIPGATSTSTVVSPVMTTDYWVRVIAGCGTQDGSTVVIVTGTICFPPTITTQPASSSISAGSPVTLTVVAGGAAPFMYQWYIGDKGDVSHPIVGATLASLTQSPAATTKYWVRVSHTCDSQTADSNAATITVTPVICTNPSITTQPANVSVGIGSTATLKVVAAGASTLHYQWFQGAKGDTSKPVGTDSATLVTGVIKSTTSFWVHVTNQCANGTPADSNAATVTAVVTRGRAVRH
jgi:hypothetical protein